MEERIDKAERILEAIMEADPRTFSNPNCDNDWIFDKVHEALMMLKYGQTTFLKKTPMNEEDFFIVLCILSGIFACELFQTLIMFLS